VTGLRLAAMDHGGRVERLREAIAAAHVDALLITDPISRRYLTGFTGSAGLVVVTGERLRFVTDGRYGEQAADQLAAAGLDAEIEVTGSGQQAAVVAAVAVGARVGLEAESVTWAAKRRYATEWFADHEVVATERLVADLRIIKEPAEVERIEAAASIADEALAALAPGLVDGPSEAEFGLALDSEMRRRGATAPSFETIVASGPNGARPHARPSERVVRTGDLVVVDFGAVVDGYCSDMTRTFAVGEVSATARRMLDVVRAAQAAGVDAVSEGVAGADVDGVCRAVIDEAGWGDAFMHGTGHGVGLEIHEDPRVSASATGTLAAGHIVTVEPGVYLPEHGGVRIEDTVVVTETGCRALTRAPKNPDPAAASAR
jgi:Xaa-Pro aminopeptidase